MIKQNGNYSLYHVVDTKFSLQLFSQIFSTPEIDFYIVNINHYFDNTHLSAMFKRSQLCEVLAVNVSTKILA